MELNELTFTSNDYKNYFNQFIKIIGQNKKETTQQYMIDTLSKIGVIQNIGDKLILNNNFESYFEVGPGEGIMTGLIGSIFKNISVCEMNPIFAEQIRQRGENYKVIEENIITTDIEKLPQFDLCICSHVFYYLSESEIKIFYEKVNKIKRNDQSKVVVSFGGFDKELMNLFYTLAFEFYNELNSHLKQKSFEFVDFKSKKLIIDELTIDYVDKILEKTQIKKISSYEYINKFLLNDIKEAIIFFTFYVSEGILNLPSVANEIKDTLKFNLTQLQEIISTVIEKYLIETKYNLPTQISYYEYFHVC